MKKYFKMKENNVTLNEYSFTNLCKLGFYTFYSKEYGRNEISFTKSDIKKLAIGEILEKKINSNYRFVIHNVDLELIKEIIKRSPIYSDLYYEI